MMKLFNTQKFPAVNRFKSLLMLVLLSSSAFSLSKPPMGEENKTQVTVYNDLTFSRENETVSISLTKLHFDKKLPLSSLAVKELGTQEVIPLQFVDSNHDGVDDSVIFAPKMAASSSKRYQFYFTENKANDKTNNLVSYSRFVPERIDDYAWENDRVAFRVYGPKARQIAESGKRGGIVSSGVDCWLKRVDYPILDKWYKKHADGTGDYHKDTGEGLDNYHVGKSLGCGGVGSIYQDKLLVSGNYSSYKTTTVGPIRTSFELGYMPWNTGKSLINETKYISLDKGSNLTRYELIFDQEVELVAGLSLDRHSLAINVDESQGFYSSWRKQKDSELGLGIVAQPKYVTGYQRLKIKGKAGEHLFVHLKSINKRIVYFAGFGWKKNQRFTSPQPWQQYLSQFSQQLQQPLRIEVN